MVNYKGIILVPPLNDGPLLIADHTCKVYICYQDIGLAVFLRRKQVPTRDCGFEYYCIAYSAGN
jgi:hypothetical protein